MTDIDVAALRAAAEGATPGPWFSDDPSQGNGPWPTTGLFTGDPDNCHAEFDHQADAQFAAAANPAVVLELLDELEFLRGEDETAHRDWIKLNRAHDLLGGGTYCGLHGDVRDAGCQQCHDVDVVEEFAAQVLDGVENGFEVHQMDDRTIAMLAAQRKAKERPEPTPEQWAAYASSVQDMPNPYGKEQP